MTEFEIRGSLKSLIAKLFIVISGISFAPLIATLLFKSGNIFESGNAQLCLIIAALFTVFIFWIKSYKIVFRENKLSYKSVFSEEASIKLSEIKRAKYKAYGSTYYETRHKLYPKIFLYPSARGKENSIEITLSVFNKDDLQKLYDLLDSIDKLPFKRNAGKK